MSPAIRPVPAPPKPFAWSEEQTAIFEWAQDGEGNLVVQARAGSGKTTTIKVAFEFMPEQGRLAYLVFNKRNQKEAEAKIKDHRVEVKTLNSLGQAFVRRVWSNAKPDPDFEFTRAERVLFGHTSKKELIAACAKLVGFLKNTTLNPSQEQAYEIGLSQDCLGNSEAEAEMIVCAALRVLEISKVQEPDGSISFNDQVWLPVVMGWVRPWYDVVVIDEAQDMNLPQLMMAKQACKEGGRIIVVGDDRQAIYGFRGAVQDGMRMMKLSLNASVLGLTVTRRNPKAVVRIAQEYVPDFKAADDAPEGVVGNLNEFAMMEMLKPSDAILSRLNAPLMPLALALLRKQIPARIEGRDIGKHLSGMVASMKANSVPHFVTKVEEWHSKQRERLEGSKNPEKKLEQVADIAQTLIALSEGCNEVYEIGQRLQNLFQDTDQNSKPAVVLSSVHKAKGLEWPRVFLLSETFRKKGPSAQAEKDSSQEANVYYVAITRAQRELYFVAGKGEPAAKATSSDAGTQANLDANAATPAQQINVAPAAQVALSEENGGDLATREQAVPGSSGAGLDPRLWKQTDHDGFESAPKGSFWRAPGMVFAYGKAEYVVIEANQTCAKCHPLAKVSRTMKFTDGEGEEAQKTIESYPRILKTSLTIDREGVLRMMTEAEVADFLAGKRPTVRENQTTSSDKQDQNETNNMPQKVKKDRKDYSGRSPFIAKTAQAGTPKAEAYAECVKRWGWDTDKGKADFNKKWDNAKSGKSSPAKTKPAAKSKKAAPAPPKGKGGKKAPPAAPKAPPASAPAAPAPSAPPPPPAPAAPAAAAPAAAPVPQA